MRKGVEMKKKFYKIWMFYLSAILCSIGLSLNAQALTINDSTGGATTYYGGMVQGGTANDVIGDGFAVDQMQVTQSNGFTTVVLNGAYFGTSWSVGASMFNGNPVGTPGDLYISTGGWRVNKPADHARFDIFEGNEGWNYVVSYANQKIYKLDFNAITSSGSEGGYWSTSGYRDGQAWRNGYGDLVGDASVSIDVQSLTFAFASLGDAYAMGYHWTMACGNDVVEGGGKPVPEPSTILLLGLGLIGFAGMRRKE